jgi:transposase
MKEILLGSAKIAVDETRAPVLDPGRGRTKTGYFWAISRDDRPWGGSDPPGVAYTYAPGRGGEPAVAAPAVRRGWCAASCVDPMTCRLRCRIGVRYTA